MFTLLWMAALRHYCEFMCLQGKDVCASAANMYVLSASIWKDEIDCAAECRSGKERVCMA